MIEQEISWLLLRQYGTRRAKGLVVILPEIEHSADAGKAITGEISNDRREPKHSKPNTAIPAAEHILSLTRISDGSGGGAADRGGKETREERAKGQRSDLDCLQAWPTCG
jgi:hypothetical protein